MGLKIFSGCLFGLLWTFLEYSELFTLDSTHCGMVAWHEI
jgi:hypothetical protein